MTLQHANGQRHIQGLGTENADDRLLLWLCGLDRGQFVIAASGAIVDHEVLAALGFDNVTKGGEGFFAQRLDDQCAHVGLLVRSFMPLSQWERGFIGLLGDFAEQAQAADTAVREHVHPYVGDRAQRVDLLAELVLGVHLQFLAWQQLAPEQALGLDLAVGAAFDEGRLDRAAVRVVAFEVQGVDDDAFDLARMAEGDDYPVVTWGTATCSFPAVAHVDATARVEDVAHAAEVFVRAGQGATAIQCRSQVNFFVVTYVRPVAERYAIDAQTCDAAVRIDVEAQVGEGLCIGNFMVVVAVALQLYCGQYFSPLGGIGRVAFSDKAAFQGCRRREVTGEEAGVDVHTLDRARYAQADYRAVITFEALAARLPAIHPLAVVIEHALLPYGRGRLEQTVNVGEPVVGDRDGLGAQARVGAGDVFLKGDGVR